LIRLRNPLHADRDILRPTLLPSLLGIAAENLKHERGVRLFETARVYLPSPVALPREANTLALVLAGARDPFGRFATDGELDFFDLKGTLEALFLRLGVQGVEYRRLDEAPFHPGRAAGLFAGETRLGILGELRPDRAAAFGIEVPRVAAAEIDLDALRDIAHPVPTDVTSPRFLPVEQDFAIVVAEETPAADVAAAVRSGAGPLATDIALFDIYRGPQIGPGRKSLAYRVTFTAPDRALTDAELGKVRDRLARTLRQRVGGELRT
jgi:phenylalanyl-tRNA synthetase beta chain